MEIKNKLKKQVIIPIISIIVILVILFSIFIFSNNSKSESEEENINMDVNPVIFYNFYDRIAMVLEDGQVFSPNITITWPDGCTGTIKKDKKDYSNENGTTLTKDGNYEITVVAPNKEKVSRKIVMDKTAPKVSIEEKNNSSVISFDDISDIETAILYKFDETQQKYIQKSDLKADGLKENVEITEKGFYLLECTDYVQNINSQNFTVGAE